MLSLTNTADLMSIEDKSKSLSFFLCPSDFICIIAPWHLNDKLFRSFFGPTLEFTQWQAPDYQKELQNQFLTKISELSPLDLYQWQILNIRYSRAFTPRILFVRPALTLRRLHSVTQFCAHLFCYYNVRL